MKSNNIPPWVLSPIHFLTFPNRMLAVFLSITFPLSWSYTFCLPTYSHKYSPSDQSSWHNITWLSSLVIPHLQYTSASLTPNHLLPTKATLKQHISALWVTELSTLFCPSTDFFYIHGYLIREGNRDIKKRTHQEKMPGGSFQLCKLLLNITELKKLWVL